MEKSLRNPKRVFPFHGQTRIPNRVGLKGGDRTKRFYSRFELKSLSSLPLPCRIGFERPYGVRYLKVWPGKGGTWTDTHAVDDATVFADHGEVAHWLVQQAEEGGAPWSLFVEPV